MDFSTSPKIELHLHLDCSLSYEVVKQIDPEVSEAAYYERFVGPSKCRDLKDYLAIAVSGIELMQTREHLQMVTLDLFKQLKGDGVIYAEIRFSPLQHTSKGLKPEEVVAIVNDAVMEGIAAYGVECGIILCTLRHFSATESMETVKLVEQFRNTQVVGFDIAGDEAGFPVDNHIEAFRYAREKGIPCTAHAGEASGADSVYETLEQFRPCRIGHGVRSIEDLKLMNLLKRENIHLEICPTSNVKTNVYERHADHPADMIYKHGVSMSLSTDGRTISNVSLTGEYQKMKDTFNWTRQHLKKCNLEAIKHAFASDEMKEKLRLIIETAY